MRLEASQQVRLEQQMKLAPRIIQAMEILQLPMMALQERVDAEMEKNPVLEVKGPLEEESVAPPAEDAPPGTAGEQPLVVDDGNGNQEDFARLADFEEEMGAEFLLPDVPYRSPRSYAGERDAKMDAMANAPAPGESLHDHLLGQWAFVDAPADVKAAGRLIISYIEDDGYLRTPLEDLPGKTTEPVTLEALRMALKLVQVLEPVGVGAGDLRECLLLQLQAEAAVGREVGLETEIVSRLLHDVEMNRLPQIARRTGRTVGQVKAAIENISHLNPRPGLLIGERSAPVITPDAVVDRDDGGKVTVRMVDEYVPRLRISHSYRRMAKDRGTGSAARQFIQKNIRSAQWLISAIEQRRDTVRRVVEEVFQVQSDFLESGREALKPLPMADVARKVGVHVATVSRAVAGKYVQTPRGIFALRAFFSGGTKTADGEDVSWEAVKVKLKELVAGEDKSEPLDDDKLAKELSRHGIKIARRTVAKYRGLLDIPSARKRRQY